MIRKITTILGLLLVLLNFQVFSQITTSGIKGMLVNEKNEPVMGANIVAVHQPSGTQYGTISNEDGYFTIYNLRVGGPYQVTISFVGYSSQVYNDIVLSLGNAYDLQATMTQQANELSEVVVSYSRSSLINSDRTGAAINVSNEMISSIPTISRGLKDFTKLSPLANVSGSGTSFAGSNNRYNQFAIDGMVNNDVFGLAASGTNGGQTGIEPVSLDAIEEFQINIAPYDVRQGGFTGGGINAVTKSGTNTFHGSVYGYGNNQSLVGKNQALTNKELKVADYEDYQTGFTVGGPIIKDKLFFFVNGEMTRTKTPLSYMPGTSLSNITLDEINKVLTVLDRIAPNYEPGDYLDLANETKSNKFLAKINWNISDKHKLVLRHSYTYGENTSNSRSINSLRFSNNGLFFPSTTNSTGIELLSNLSSNMSNRLMIGYTRVRDDRDPLGSPFPTVLINLGSGKTITMGSEYSSVANQLDQDIISLDDDFNFYLGNHTLTIGTHNEFYSFYNLFVQNIYGNYAYKSLANFESIGTDAEVAPTYYGIGYSFADDGPSQGEGAGQFNAMQLGFYLQDDYQLTDNIKVTAGIRADIPVFMDKPDKNDAFNTAYAAQDVATGEVPTTKILWSPRLGFNWDVLGDKSLQIRGGTGLFTGRVPFVWVSNQFSNNGQLNGAYSTGSSSSSANPITNPAGIKFVADPFSQKKAEDLGKTAGRGAINVIDKDFKFPQVFRSNLAIDKTLPLGMVLTLEGIFSKTYNNVNFVNLNRKVDEAFTFVGVDQRPRYISNRVDANFDEIVKFENTNEGFSYNFVAQLQKTFQKGFVASAAYTYGHSEDLNSGTSSVAYSNWRYVNQVEGLNNLMLTRSNFDIPHRVVVFASYRLEYLNGMMSSQISVFYNGQSGQALSYIYNGDLNNDGTTNDMIYIPKSMSDINLITIPATTGTNPTPAVTPEEQWTKLDAFINGNEYLSAHRGEYAERNADHIPFQHQFDLKFLQELKMTIAGADHRFQLGIDIINIGNMLNKDWGHSNYATNQQNALINYKGLASGTSQPTYTYDGKSLINAEAYSISDFNSRWRAQVSFRYIF